MIKTLISIVIIAALAFGAWEVKVQFDKYQAGKDVEEQQRAAVNAIVPEQLTGMPQDWEAAYKKATNGGLKTWQTWMKAYGQRVDDPRRAWIEMDYMVVISKEDPREAKTIFSDIKERTPTNSQIYPRVQQLEKTYQ